jgi:hypothetical protein
LTVTVISSHGFLCKASKAPLHQQLLLRLGISDKTHMKDICFPCFPFKVVKMVIVFEQGEKEKLR